MWCHICDALKGKEQHKDDCKFATIHDNIESKSKDGKYFVEENLCPVCLEVDFHCSCSFEEIGIVTKKRNDFKVVKQSYDTEYPETLICKCGNDKFLVGQGNHYTAIKCTICGLEIGIHSG